MYRVVIHRRVGRYLRQLPPSLKESIKESLEVLANNPYQSSGIKAMKREWQGYYRNASERDASHLLGRYRKFSGLCRLCRTPW